MPEVTRYPCLVRFKWENYGNGEGHVTVGLKITPSSGYYIIDYARGSTNTYDFRKWSGGFKYHTHWQSHPNDWEPISSEQLKQFIKETNT
jgi:hypothetical protein